MTSEGEIMLLYQTRVRLVLVLGIDMKLAHLYVVYCRLHSNALTLDQLPYTSHSRGADMSGIQLHSMQVLRPVACLMCSMHGVRRSEPVQLHALARGEGLLGRLWEKLDPHALKWNSSCLSAFIVRALTSFMGTRIMLSLQMADSSLGPSSHAVVGGQGAAGQAGIHCEGAGRGERAHRIWRRGLPGYAWCQHGCTSRRRQLSHPKSMGVHMQSLHMGLLLAKCSWWQWYGMALCPTCRLNPPSSLARQCSRTRPSSP